MKLIASTPVMVSRYLCPLAMLAILHAGGQSELVYAQGQALREMGHATWTAGDGAPQAITHLTQDPDGSLWIGSESGLFNFDGQTFRPFESPLGEPKLPASEVYSLLMTKAGTLWVAFNKGGLARIAAGRVTLYDTADAKPIGSVEQLREAPDGSVWAMDSRQRLIRFGTDGAWLTEPAPTSGLISGIFVDTSNTLWVAQGGFLHRRPLAQPLYVRTVRADVVAGFAETPNGEIWINDEDPTTSLGRIRQISLTTGRLIRTYPHGLPSSGMLVSTAGGSLIVTSFAAGVRRLSADELASLPNVPSNTEPDIVDRANGLAGGATRAVMVDTHGNIWIGGLRGLDRLKPAQLTRYLTEVKDTGWALCATKLGDMWVANVMGEVYSVSGPTRTRFHDAGDPIFSLACADVGRAWFVNGSGIWSIDAGRVTALPRITGARQREFLRIVAASDHTLYATVTGAFENGAGVWRYTDGQWAKLQGDGELGAGGYSAYVDRRDRLWIGYTRGRAILHSANDTQMYSSGSPGLGYIHAFLETSHGLFAAGTNGLAIVRDSRFEMLTYAEPSLVRGVRGMVEARNGDLWLNSANGFAQVSAKELNAAIANPAYPMKVRLVRDGDFANAAGPHSVISYWDTAARDSEGQLWFSTRDATRSEIVRFAPESSGTANQPPRLTIRSIVADGQPLPNNRVVAAATRTVDIQYFGVNLSAPESVVYQYRLEGIDKSWQPAGHRTEIGYSRLPPGTYTFRVIASSSDGIWTDPVSSAPFTVLPRFYQTWWFAVTMAALVAVIVTVFHKARLRRVARAMNVRFDERLAERTRVARELHDTLLQTVHGSKLVADRALRNTVDRDRLVQALEQLSVWLGQAAAEGRAALQSLRASTTESNDLAGAFRRAVDECRHNSSADTPFSVQGRARELHPAVRDEVYRIGYEAIRNACVHSRANRIDVAIEYGRDLMLRISDNGAGIDAAVIETGKDGHFGLRGMRERAERIGAMFTLASGPGTGTAITLLVPGRIAFLTRRD
jgi:signal transduction histidine kinase/ligand-binding sensor domain-containing protein